MQLHFITSRSGAPLLALNRVRKKVLRTFLRTRTTAAATGNRGARQSPPENLIAIDVEYIHYKASPSAQGERHLAAWIALVDSAQRTVLKTECRPPLPENFVWVGGVPPARLEDAPNIADVALQVQNLIAGKRLIGHGLLKDLQALGLQDHPDTYDTMCFPPFQNKSGSARSLRHLAAKLLGMDLHAPTQSHDPEEDAAVVMQLYTKHVHHRLITDYSLLVDWYTKKTIEQVSMWQQEQHQASI